MYSIESEDLAVMMLDPARDQKRFGTRYSTGGYIFSVIDKKNGKNLMTGPTYPKSFNTYDGQGIPDAFHRNPIYLKSLELFLVPGIGICDLKKNKVLEFCKWYPATNGKTMVFTTRQTAEDISFTITRTVSVEGTKIISKTRIANNEKATIPICWYPHPFFPPKMHGTFLTVSNNAKFTSPTGFYNIENGNISRVEGISQEKSFQALQTGENTLSAIMHAPSYDCLIETDYHSMSAPVWANQNTCSIEPYFEATLYQYNTLEWSISYEYKLDS